MPKVPKAETHTMKGWGLKYADLTEPRTLEEAQATGILMSADRLLDIMTALQDISTRLAHFERFMHEYIPGYAEANQQPPPSPPSSPDGTVPIKAIRGVRIH